MIRTLPVLVAALLAAPSGWTSGPAAQVPAPGQVTPPRGVGPAAATATGTGVIRGAVVAMDTGTPLRRVQVRAYSNSPDARGTRTMPFLREGWQFIPETWVTLWLFRRRGHAVEGVSRRG
jgi:hypothetical protein